MSLAYPEGEAFFLRSALKQESSSFDPDKPSHFYAHLLVEFIWNKPAFHGSTLATYRDDVHKHPRSPYKVVTGSWWSTHYGNWEKICFLYGKRPCPTSTAEQKEYRQVEHNLCVDGNRFRDQEKGGALESFFMIIPMPLLARGEEWLFIDVRLLACLLFRILSLSACSATCSCTVCLCY
jgi:hypothetical protein